MLEFEIIKDKNNQKKLLTAFIGKPLLTIPQLNKGTAFTEEERQKFCLTGKLPAHIETLEQQIQRAYLQYCSYDREIEKNIYLNYLLNHNHVLFYKLISEHITEMLPTIYTPIVGHVVKEFNQRFFQPRGLYISYDDQDRISEILKNRSNPDVKLIVVSDGEGVLGIGDQGVGAMAIPVAKLMVYSAIGHVDANATLPILLDAGTNNQEILNDPLYLGWPHARMSGKKYDVFIDKFIQAVKKEFPHIFLHWEDFGRHNAYRNLIEYREKICSFNDDIQGTGVVAMAAVLAAIKLIRSDLSQQRIVIFGAGSAGIGITENIYRALLRCGLSEQEAKAKLWLVDRPGLLTEYVAEEVTSSQQTYLRSKKEIDNWSVVNRESITLLEVIEQVKPTILIGCSAQAGAFTETIVTKMAEFNDRPIIFPLSIPPEKAEATPEDLICWTQGKALIATGNPFKDIEYNGQYYPVTQCNNYLAFPGIGLGVISCQAIRVSDDMLWTASEALSEYGQDHPVRLLPTIQQVADDATRAIAIAVVETAFAENLAALETEKTAEQLVDENIWIPHYLPYERRQY